MNTIELNNDTFTKDILDGTTFFQLAEGGAMGEPGGVTFMTEDGKVYHANYCFGNLKRKTMEEAFPVLSECRFKMFGYDSEVPAGWVYVNLFMGNHLIVRKDYYERFEPLITEYKGVGELYANWLRIAASIK